MSHRGEQVHRDLRLGQQQLERLLRVEAVEAAVGHRLGARRVLLVEESGLGERLPRLDVPDGGRAPVAEELEDLETALGEQVERRGGVPLQEQRAFGRQQHGPRDGRDPRQLLVVELGEELRGAQVEQGLTAGLGHRQEYIWRNAAPAAGGRPVVPRSRVSRSG